MKKKKQRQMRSDRRPKSSILQLLEITPDLTEGSIQIWMKGRREAVITNHKKLLEIRKDHIVAAGKRQKIIINGENLSILFYCEEGMLVKGIIKSISLDTLYE